MLITVEAVIETLGGTFKAAEIAAVQPSAISNWKTRKRIPSDYFMLISQELDKRGAAVSPTIFGFADPPLASVSTSEATA